MSDKIDDVIKKVYSESDIPNMDKEILDFLKSMLEPDNIELKTHINKKNLNNFVLLELYANSVKHRKFLFIDSILRLINSASIIIERVLPEPISP